MEEYIAHFGIRRNGWAGGWGLLLMIPRNYHCYNTAISADQVFF